MGNENKNLYQERKLGLSEKLEFSETSHDFSIC